MLPLKICKFLTDIKAVAPFYHTVSNEHLPHIQHLYNYNSIDKFEKAIDYFLLYYSPVTLQYLIKMVKENIKPEKPLFFLSFDDGLREFYDIIAPILLKKGVPATCFLNSSFIGNQKLFYRYKASVLIDKLHNSKSNLLWQQYHKWQNKNELNQGYYRKVILTINYNRQSLLDELAIMLDVNFDEYLVREKPYMHEDQIRELIKKGFTFGAHSLDHPDYRSLSLNIQLQQTTESINEIKKKFSLDYAAFSFPFTDFNVTRSFFYQLKDRGNIDLSFGSAGLKKDSINWNIQRIPMEESSLSARKRLKRDYLYYMMKAPLGKNKINRY